MRASGLVVELEVTFSHLFVTPLNGGKVTIKKQETNQGTFHY